VEADLNQKTVGGFRLSLGATPFYADMTSRTIGGAITAVDITETRAAHQTATVL
jgi:hypothetical protein